MRVAEQQGGTPLDVYRAVEWHIKARKNRNLTAYFRANYKKPEESDESEENEEQISEDSRDETELVVHSTPKERPKPESALKSESAPTPTFSKPLIRPSTPQRMATEKVVQDLLVRIQDLEARESQKEQELNALRKITKDTAELASSASQTASTATNATSVLAGQAEVRAKAFIPKLVPFTNEKDDIRLYIRRFENYAKTLNLTQEQQLHEFIAHGRGPIESIVLTKDLDNWTIDELKQSVLSRLAPNWDINRIEQELYKLKIEGNDDPDSVMGKIEQVLIKRDPTIQISRLRHTQFNHFVRLIHIHEPMHTYVLNEMDTSTDPDKALEQARQYLRKKGNDVTYFRHLVHQSLKDAGVVTKEVDTTIFPLDEKQSCTSTSEQTPSASSKPTVTTKTENTAMQMSSAPVTQEFVEQFVKKTDKLTQEQMNRRFNDLERLMRDLHVAGLPDFLKKAEIEKFRKGKNSFSAPSTRTNEKSNRTFEKNHKGKDKRYKKKYVEKENGEVIAQYTSDESGDEDSKSE